jgi:hypothetical protein
MVSSGKYAYDGVRVDTRLHSTGRSRPSVQNRDRAVRWTKLRCELCLRRMAGERLPVRNYAVNRADAIHHCLGCIS